MARWLAQVHQRAGGLDHDGGGAWSCEGELAARIRESGLCPFCEGGAGGVGAVGDVSHGVAQLGAECSAYAEPVGSSGAVGGFDPGELAVPVGADDFPASPGEEDGCVAAVVGEQRGVVEVSEFVGAVADHKALGCAEHRAQDPLLR